MEEALENTKNSLVEERIARRSLYNCCCKKFTYVETDVMKENNKPFPETECCGGLMRFLIPLRALFCWMLPIFCLGCCKVTLKPSDLPRLSSQYESSHYLSKFKTIWKKTVFLKKGQLPICLYIVFGLEYGFAAILKIIATGFQVMIPFFLSFFLHEFHPRITTTDETDFERYRNILPNDLKPPTELKELGYRDNDGKIWLWLFLMVIFQFFGYLFTQNSYYFATRVGGKMRVLLGALISEKVFTVRPDRIHESKHPKGELLNYFATDAFMVDLAHWFILDLLGALIIIGVAVYFLVDLIGVSAVFVFLTAALVLTIVTFLTTFVFVFRKKYFGWIDRRITLLRESFYNIKIIKWFQWEDFYRKKIQEIRSKELLYLRLIFLCLAIVNALGIVTPPCLTVAGFGHFYINEGYVDVVNLFSASAYFLLLRIPIISFAQNSIMYFTGLVSMLRIQTFLQEPDRDETSKCYKRFEYDDRNTNAVEIESGSFVWSHEDIEKCENYEKLQEQKTSQINTTSSNNNQTLEDDTSITLPSETQQQQQVEVQEEEILPLILKNVSVRIPNGSLVMVVGPSGSGKTSFLSSILGETISANASTRVRTNGSFAYCQQPPWIQNVSLRENVLFTHTYNEKKFHEVLETCHLEEDFKALGDSGLMEIGEAGSTVSSGQQSRISLARACYSDSDIYLLDNVLANLDTYVAASVFEDCIMKYLGETTRIMVTKKLHLCSCADVILVFKDGIISERGTYEELRGNQDSIFNSLYLEGESEEKLKMNNIETILKQLHSNNKKKDTKTTSQETIVDLHEEEESEELSDDDEELEEEKEEGGEEIGMEDQEFNNTGPILQEEIRIEDNNTLSTSTSQHSTSSSSSSKEEEEQEEEEEEEEEEETTTTKIEDLKNYRVTELEERVIGFLPIRAVCSYLCYSGGCCIATFVLTMYFLSVCWYFVFEFHIGNFAEQLMYHEIYGKLYDTQFYVNPQDNSQHFYENSQMEEICVQKGYTCRKESVEITWDKNYSNGTLLTPGINNNLSLGIYAMATFVLFFLVIIESSIFFQCFITRGQRMFKRALKTLINAPVVVFDKHPIGRLISRLSYDVASLENETLVKFDNVMNTFYVSTIAMLMVCFLTSFVFLPVLIVAVILYVVIYLYIRKPTMELKRIEAVSRSPLFQTFSSQLEGRATIRAYGVTGLVIENTRKHIDYHNRSYYLVNVAVRTLEEYLNIVSVLLVFFAGLIAIIVGFYFPEDFKSAAFTDAFKDLGMGLTYSISLIPEMFPIAMSDFVYGETKLNAIERLEYYGKKLKREEKLIGINSEKSKIRSLLEQLFLDNKTKDEQEKVLDIKKEEHHGSDDEFPLLKFENVRVKYQNHLPWVLKDLNFEVTRKQSIGVVGKTGSGKTSLFLAMTRIVKIEEGRVLLDGKDIGREIPLHQLRNRFSVLPAHPVLFEGSIRSNLDPLGKLTKTELLEGIDQCGGTEIVEKHGGLEGHVEDGGGNFSEGEKQILSLARAVVKKDADILLIDEYSSTMDDNVVQVVQETIRKLEDITVLSISHNLGRVIQHDRILVLDEGRILEFDTPRNLLNDTNSIFYKMVELSPNRNELHRIVSSKT